MKICIDIQSAITQRAGIGRYTRHLVQHLGPAMGTDKLNLFYFDFKRKGIPFKVPNATHKAVHWCPGTLAQYMWKKFDKPILQTFTGDADVFHFPNFILPPSKKAKTVVTIHDLTFLKYPDYVESHNLEYLKSKIKDTVKRADAIITVSKFVAKEVQEMLKVDASKIFPVYSGISTDFKPLPPKKIETMLNIAKLKKPYILFVGTIEPRKNINFLVDVFEKMKNFKGTLVMVGMPGWRIWPIVEKMKKSPRTNDIRVMGYVSDTQLPAVYQGAELMIFPSHYEGFGFPPLEAMASGTPVLSSTGGALGEILPGGGVMTLDKFDSDQWAAEAEKIIADQELRKKMIAEGVQHAAKFTWAETAKNTLEVYRKIAK